MLSSDGIWDCVDNKDGIEFIYEGMKMNPDMQLSQLIAEMQDEVIASEADEQGGPGSDNMCAILVDLR